MIYLDNAATSYPKPEETYRLSEYALRVAGANPGRSGHKMALEAARLVYQCRENACALFHTNDPSRWVFCQNGTDALNLAIKGFVRLGMHVLTSVWDHNAVLRPLFKMKENGLITLTVTKDPVKALENGDFDLVVTTQVCNVTGKDQNLPALSALCSKKGIPLILDAAQSAGHFPIDLAKTPVTLFCCPGHKGLFGPQGTGLMYLRDNLILETLKEGGTGTHSQSVLQPYESPERYESGTLNTPGIAGLSAGLVFVQKHQEEIRQKEKELTQFLLQGLKQIRGITLYAEGEGGLVSFLLKGRSSGEIVDLCNQADIYLRGGLHCAPLVHQTLGTLQTGLARLSLGFFNTKDELSCFLTQIEKMAN